MASNGTDGETSADRNVEIWKIKKLIKSLEAARGYVIRTVMNYEEKQVNSVKEK